MFGDRDREEKGVEEIGMSDLQFKSFLKQLVKRMEDAKNEPEAEEAKAKLEEIIQDLKSDIES
jgi:ribosomal protein S20